MYNKHCRSAGVAELADAPDLGSGVHDVQVQVLSPAPAGFFCTGTCISSLNGALAQLGAHHTGSVGVRGSSPLCSTKRKRLNYAVCGAFCSISSKQDPLFCFTTSERVKFVPVSIYTTALPFQSTNV